MVMLFQFHGSFQSRFPVQTAEGGDLGDAVIGKVDGGQFAAPKRTGIEGEDVVGVHKAQ